tara:strand:- start:1571 stop:2500 length:930 start_codon:yes stop_codon:yes gene_type:complete
MKALLFPGQGSQVVGMGLEFYNNFEIVKKIFTEADDSLNFKISKIILEGPEDKLKLTQNTQPAILIVSWAIFNVLKNDFGLKLNNFKYYAGHSLGEYSALVCSGSLKFKDALYLLHERGKAMQEAVPVGKGAMIAILGSKIQEINQFISKAKKNNGVCEIANDNSDGQTIVSGDKESIFSLQKILKDNKKKAILLPVSAPFHCALMKSAANKMKTKIEPINFERLNFEIISNVTALPEKDPETIKKLLVEQIHTKVRWRESVINMSNNGINEFIEIGPGKVLSGLVKRIIKDAKADSINSIEDAKNNTK